ncbi:MAG TPA: hypothetical protein PLW24_21305, partial [Burkholderiaceae bacterium]|nr:hypothetical protein [Burkholderiaceae bacterium]
MVTLSAGIVVGDRTLFDVVLRPALLTDTYRATELVPVPDDLESPQSRVAYQMRIDDAVVLCQIEALGELEGDEVPGPGVLAEQLEPDDMALLRGAAARVKKKLLQSRSKSLISGGQSASSSAAAS